MKIDRYNYRKSPHRASSEFSEHLANQICAEAIDTPSVAQIANRVGIPARTLYRWLQNGRDGDERFSEFAMRFAKARGTHEDRWLANVEDVAQLDDPKAANAKLRANEFLLKSHFPHQYTERAHVTTHIDNATTFNLKVLSTEQLRVFRTMLKAVDSENDNEEEVQQLLAEIPINVTEAE